MENPNFHLLWISASVDLVWLQPTPKQSPLVTQTIPASLWLNQLPSPSFSVKFPQVDFPPRRLPTAWVPPPDSHCPRRHWRWPTPRRDGCRCSPRSWRFSAGPWNAMECHGNQLDIDHEQWAYKWCLFVDVKLPGSTGFSTFFNY